MEGPSHHHSVGKETGLVYFSGALSLLKRGAPPSINMSHVFWKAWEGRENSVSRLYLLLQKKTTVFLFSQMLHAKRFSEAQEQRVKDPTGRCGAGHSVLSQGKAFTLLPPLLESETVTTGRVEKGYFPESLDRG